MIYNFYFLKAAITSIYENIIVYYFKDIYTYLSLKNFRQQEAK